MFASRIRIACWAVMFACTTRLVEAAQTMPGGAHTEIRQSDSRTIGLAPHRVSFGYYPTRGAATADGSADGSCETGTRTNSDAGEGSNAGKGTRDCQRPTRRRPWTRTPNPRRKSRPSRSQQLRREEPPSPLDDGPPEPPKSSRPSSQSPGPSPEADERLLRKVLRHRRDEMESPATELPESGRQRRKAIPLKTTLRRPKKCRRRSRRNNEKTTPDALAPQTAFRSIKSEPSVSSESPSSETANRITTSHGKSAGQQTAFRWRSTTKTRSAPEAIAPVNVMRADDEVASVELIRPRIQPCRPNRLTPSRKSPKSNWCPRPANRVCCGPPKFGVTGRKRYGFKSQVWQSPACDTRRRPRRQSCLVGERIERCWFDRQFQL